MTRDAAEVCSKTLAVCAALYFASYALDRHILYGIHDPAFRRGAAFAIVETAAAATLSFYLLGLRVYTQGKENLDEQIRPAIRDRVFTLAFEGESWPSGEPIRGPARRVVEENVGQALTSLKASGRDRVARFALEQGFIAEWVKAFLTGSKGDRKRAVALLGLVSPVAGSTILPVALQDQQPAVRVAAYRALILSDPCALDTTFRSVLKERLLVRALLVDDLKQHALYLLKHTIPALLERATVLEAARCFEILIGWKRALPAFDIHLWLSGDPDPLLWPLVLTLLPYVSIDDSVETYVVSALRSDDLEVRCAAANAAGHLKLERLIPVLLPCLSENKRLALASATAVAQMGEAGGRCLERIVVGSDRRAAAVAMEALERKTVRQ